MNDIIDWKTQSVEAVKIVTEFENKVAEFFGAPYAVATDCCTHALELSLIHSKAKEIRSPTRTYISVPMLADKLKIKRTWNPEPWQDYEYITDKVVDAAVLWKRNSYIPGTYMCISFHSKKHFKLVKGGIILLDNKYARDELEKMAYDGRARNTYWRVQDISTLGYHYYMPWETAELGVKTLQEAIERPHIPWSWTDWDDLTKMEIFRNG